MKKEKAKSKIIFAGLVLFFASFGVARASTLFFTPQSQDVYSGETFVMEARIDTEGTDVNVVDGIIKYPPDKIEAVDIADGDSIISLWVQRPMYSEEKGKISFTGGIPKGFVGEGNIFKIVFKSKSENISEGEVNFDKNTRVLLNDGKGTEDKLNYLTSSFGVMEKSSDLPVITSSSHPYQNIWYSNENLNLRWDLKEGAEYSFLISRDPVKEVDEIPDKPEGKLIWMGDMSYNGLEDGIYYFHLRQKLRGEEWSSKTTFRVMIDSMKPEEFTPEITDFEGKKYLIFNTRDTTSGIDRYEISEEENWQLKDFKLSNIISRTNIPNPKSWVIVASPYLLKDQGLNSKIIIKAIDKAGNETLAEIHSKTRLVSIQVMIMIIVILALLIVLLWFVFKRFIKLKHDKVQ